MSERDRYLVTTEWLAAHLETPGLRILEGTVFLRPRDDGGSGYRVVPGREEWAAGHIPGSVYADLQNDLSDPRQGLRFMMPLPEQFAEAMGRYGVGDDSEVVLYDRQGNMWAARVVDAASVRFDNARAGRGLEHVAGRGRPVRPAQERLLAPRSRRGRGRGSSPLKRMSWQR
jgi:thiosulfate/3-mercaptopyruvate sulfurtransferase